MKDKLESGHDSSIVKFIKCIRLPLGFTLVHSLILFLIIVEYIGLASNEQLIRNNSTDFYYTVSHTWWKYMLLILQWLFLSHLL